MKQANYQRAYDMEFARVYPLYVAKVVRKGHYTKAEVDTVIEWLTGYTADDIAKLAAGSVTFEDFFAQAPRMQPRRAQITGVICGVRVEDIKEPLMREIRYLDKLVDEVAAGKKMENILRMQDK